MRRMYWAAAALVLAAAGSAQAAFTSINSTSTDGAGFDLYSIFETNYGSGSGSASFFAGEATTTFGSYTFTRVDDGGTGKTNLHTAYAGVTNDRRFEDGTTSVSFTTKYAGYNNRLGWSNRTTDGIVEADYNDIIGTSGSTTVSLSMDFQLVLNVGGGTAAAGAGLLSDGVGHWGSDTDTGGNDHFVTWYVSGVGSPFWVVAAEDLNLDDHDYNDWVGELQVVPLPPAAWAGISSLVGVAGFGIVRRRRLRAS